LMLRVLWDSCLVFLRRRDVALVKEVAVKVLYSSIKDLTSYMSS
jgi:hypothetical protein